MNLNELYNMDVSDIKKSATRALETGRVVDQTADRLRQDVKDILKIWKGDDADAAGVTLTRHAGRLETAGQAVRKAHKILDQLAQNLQREHEGVKAYVDSVNKRVQLQSKGYYVIDIATGAVKGGPGTTDAGAEAVKNGYMEYVDRATAADTRAATALAGIDELDKTAEVNNAYTDLNGNQWDADDEDAARSAELLTLAKTSKLSKEQRKELELLLSQNSTDAEFAGAFLKSTKFTGAKGFIEAYGNLGTEGNNSATIQKSLSKLLATGIDPTNPDAVSDAWLTEFTNALKQEHTVATKVGDRDVLGSEIAAPLVQFGDFSGKRGTDFLNNVADTVHKQQLEDPTTLGLDPKGFNPANPNYANPLNPILVSFSNNPEAAEKFFGDAKLGRSRIAYMLANSGADPEFESDLGGQLPGKEKWFLAYGRLDTDVVGDALEAGSTGKDFDEHYQKHLGPNSPEAARIFAATVNHVSHNSGDGKDYAAFSGEDGRLSALADSLANMSAFYIDDVHRELSGSPEAGKYWDLGDDHPVNFDKGSLRGFLVAIGQNPDAYNIVKAASQTLTKLKVNDVVSPSNRNEGVVRTLFDAHTSTLTYLAQGMLRAKADGAWAFANKDSVNKTIDTVKPIVDYVVDKFYISKPGGRLEQYGPEAGYVQGQITDVIANYIKKEFGIAGDKQARADQAKWRELEIQSVKEFLDSTTIDAFKKSGGNPYTLSDQYGGHTEEYRQFRGITSQPSYEEYLEDFAKTYNKLNDRDYTPRPDKPHFLEWWKR